MDDDKKLLEWMTGKRVLWYPSGGCDFRDVLFATRKTDGWNPALGYIFYSESPCDADVFVHTGWPYGRDNERHGPRNWLFGAGNEHLVFTPPLHWDAWTRNELRSDDPFDGCRTYEHTKVQFDKIDEWKLKISSPDSNDSFNANGSDYSGRIVVFRMTYFSRQAGRITRLAILADVDDL